MKNKPYGFVPLPEEFSRKAPVWHDGKGSKDRLFGEVRFELTNLTPLLVGWERRTLKDQDPNDPWRISYEPAGAEDGHVNVTIQGQRYETCAKKSVLCALRAPWGNRPVIIPGDSLKGLLRHELGALLGAPMERVAERSYSYRPNALYVNPATNPHLVARLARVPEGGVECIPLDRKESNSPSVRVPTKLDILSPDLRYDRDHDRNPPWYRFDPAGPATPYRGGQGAGQTLNSRKNLHSHLQANPSATVIVSPLPSTVVESYLHTLRHLTDPDHGHFSNRHPDVPNRLDGQSARDRILHAAEKEVFQPGDLIWVEWDNQKNEVVSFGWHYYYRWAYQDTVRRKDWERQRPELVPLNEEKGAKPTELSAVRHLLGYAASDDEGCKDIGRGNYSQLMGRIFLNAAIEVVRNGEPEESRFHRPIFLKELGQPKPSAVEHYVQQPHHPGARPSDDAQLVTYGDAARYDAPGNLAGRKFYLDRADAYTGEPWGNSANPNSNPDSDPERLNDRSTLALDVSRVDRCFRFTLRFRDLDPADLAAVLLALCPNQFGGGTHPEGYCSKLGYARPLGWGTVRIEAKGLYFIKDNDALPSLVPKADIRAWFSSHQAQIHAPLRDRWLAIHRCKHPDAGDYPRGQDGEVFTYHTNLRANHSRLRRYNGGGVR